MAAQLAIQLDKSLFIREKANEKAGPTSSVQAESPEERSSNSGRGNQI